MTEREEHRISVKSPESAGEMAEEKEKDGAGEKPRGETETTFFEAPTLALWRRRGWRDTKSVHGGGGGRGRENPRAKTSQFQGYSCK